MQDAHTAGTTTGKGSEESYEQLLALLRRDDPRDIDDFVDQQGSFALLLRAIKDANVPLALRVKAIKTAQVNFYGRWPKPVAHKPLFRVKPKDTTKRSKFKSRATKRRQKTTPKSVWDSESSDSESESEISSSDEEDEEEDDFPALGSSRKHFTLEETKVWKSLFTELLGHPEREIRSAALAGWEYIISKERIPQHSSEFVQDMESRLMNKRDHTQRMIGIRMLVALSKSYNMRIYEGSGKKLPQEYVRNIPRLFKAVQGAMRDPFEEKNADMLYEMCRVVENFITHPPEMFVVHCFDKFWKGALMILNTEIPIETFPAPPVLTADPNSRNSEPDNEDDNDGATAKKQVPSALKLKKKIVQIAAKYLSSKVNIIHAKPNPSDVTFIKEYMVPLCMHMNGILTAYYWYVPDPPDALTPQQRERKRILRHYQRPMLCDAVTYVYAFLRITYKDMSEETKKEYVMHLLFPVLCTTPEDEELRQKRPLAFVANIADGAAGYRQAPSLALRLLSLLVTYANILPVLEQSILPILRGIPKTCEETSEKDRRAKDGALSALCMMGLRTDLAKANKGADLIEVLTNCVFSECDSPYAHIREKMPKVFYWCYNALSAEIRSELAPKILRLLSDDDLAVRMHTCISVSKLLLQQVFFTSGNRLFKPHIEQILEGLCNVAQQTASQKVLRTVKNIARMRGAPPPSITCGKLCELFVHFTARGKEQTEDLDEQDLLFIAASECMSAISSIGKSYAYNPERIMELEKSVLPVIRTIVEDRTHYEFLSDGLELFCNILECGRRVSDEAWELFPLIYECANSWGSEMSEAMIAIFASYSSSDPERFLAQAGPNKIVILYKRFIEENDDAVMVQAACTQMINSALQHCRGKMDNLLHDIIEISTKLLAKTNSLSVQTAVIILIANCLYYNPHTTLGLLDIFEASQMVIELWHSIARYMMRGRDQKICLMGSSSILSLGKSLGTFNWHFAVKRTIPVMMVYAQQLYKKKERKLAAIRRSEKSKKKRAERNKHNTNHDNANAAAGVNNNTRYKRKDLATLNIYDEEEPGFLRYDNEYMQEGDIFASSDEDEGDYGDDHDSDEDEDHDHEYGHDGDYHAHHHHHYYDEYGNYYSRATDSEDEDDIDSDEEYFYDFDETARIPVAYDMRGLNFGVDRPTEPQAPADAPHEDGEGEDDEEEEEEYRDMPPLLPSAPIDSDGDEESDEDEGAGPSRKRRKQETSDSEGEGDDKSGRRSNDTGSAPDGSGPAADDQSGHSAVRSNDANENDRLIDTLAQQFAHLRNETADNQQEQQQGPFACPPISVSFLHGDDHGGDPHPHHYHIHVPLPPFPGQHGVSRHAADDGDDNDLHIGALDYNPLDTFDVESSPKVRAMDPILFFVRGMRFFAARDKEHFDLAVDSLSPLYKVSLSKVTSGYSFASSVSVRTLKDICLTHISRRRSSSAPSFASSLSPMGAKATPILPSDLEEVLEHGIGRVVCANCKRGFFGEPAVSVSAHDTVANRPGDVRIYCSGRCKTEAEADVAISVPDSISAAIPQFTFLSA